MNFPITRTAHLTYNESLLLFPLPKLSLRLRDQAGWACYLTFGDPDLRTLPAPWRHVEQMGAAHYIVGLGVHVTVETRKRSRWATEMRLLTAPEPVEE